jgi:hypothetical protein
MDLHTQYLNQNMTPNSRQIRTSSRLRWEDARQTPRGLNGFPSLRAHGWSENWEGRSGFRLPLRLACCG